jgi:hypothetical protein
MDEKIEESLIFWGSVFEWNEMKILIVVFICLKSITKIVIDLKIYSKSSKATNAFFKFSLPYWRILI